MGFAQTALGAASKLFSNPLFQTALPSSFKESPGTASYPAEERGRKKGSNPDDETAGDQTGYPYGSYGYSGYGYSSGSGQSTEDVQKLTQDAIDNEQTLMTRQANNLNENAQSIFNAYEKNSQAKKESKEQGYQTMLKAKSDMREKNDEALKARQRSIERGMNLQQREMKQQSVISALKNRGGNMWNGSAIRDLAEGVARINDLEDVNELEARRENLANAYADWFSNDSAAEGEQQTLIAQILNDIADQDYEHSQDIANYTANYLAQYGNLDSAYWQGINNINPTLAKEGLAQEQTESEAATAYKNAKKDYKAAKKKLAKEQSAAIGKSSPVSKATQKAYDDAEKIYKESKSAYKKEKGKSVTVGEDTDQYTLNAYELPSKLNLESSLANGPSEALQKMLTSRGYASATDPLSSQYVRGNAESRVYSPSSGNYNLSTAANSAFADNLPAFHRV